MNRAACLDCPTPIPAERLRCPPCHEKHAKRLSDCSIPVDERRFWMLNGNEAPDTTGAFSPELQRLVDASSKEDPIPKPLTVFAWLFGVEVAVAITCAMILLARQCS